MSTRDIRQETRDKKADQSQVWSGVFAGCVPAILAGATRLVNLHHKTPVERRHRGLARDVSLIEFMALPAPQVDSALWFKITAALSECLLRSGIVT